MEIVLSRIRDLASLVMLFIFFDEVLTDYHLRAEDNNISKRIPKHPDPDFMPILIGRLQKIQILKGGKAIVVFSSRSYLSAHLASWRFYKDQIIP